MLSRNMKDAIESLKLLQAKAKTKAEYNKYESKIKELKSLCLVNR